MSRSTSAETKNRRVRFVRLRQTLTQDLTEEDRSFLRAELEKGDFTQALDIVQTHGVLGDDNVLRSLAGRWPLPTTGPELVDVPAHLCAALGNDRYAEFVGLLADHWEAACPPDHRKSMNAALSWFVRRVRGSDRFNRVVEADRQLPDLDGTGPLGLILLRSSFHDDRECLRVLTEHAFAGADHALRIWCVARAAKDVALELAVRGDVLAQVYVALKDPAPEPARRLLQEVWNWMDADEDRSDRIDALMKCAARAKADGIPWARLEMDLPRALGRPIAKLALEGAEVTRCTLEVLRDELATGSGEAWDRFFACEAANPGHYMLRTRDLLRHGVVPAAPDDQFWSRFEAAWMRCCAFEQEQLELHSQSLRSGLHEASRAEQDRIKQLRHPEFFPLPTMGELFDKVCSRPPCSESTRLLLAAIKENAYRLDDARIAMFASAAARRPHSDLPDASALDLRSSTAVESFLLLHGACGSGHIREVLRTSDRWLVHAPQWLLNQPWAESVVDEQFRQEVVERANTSLTELIIIADRHPSWVSRETVVRALLASDRIPPIDLLPPWLDDALFTFAERATSPDVLEQLFPRFEAHKHYRKPFLDLVRKRLIAHPDPLLASLLARLLDSGSAWEKHGPQLVNALLECGAGIILQQIILDCAMRWRQCGPSGDSKRCEGAGDQAEDEAKRVEKVHLAVARGLLLWAEGRRQAGDQARVELALMSIAVLDPPRLFTTDLRTFGKREGLSDTATSWIQQIHGMTKAGARREATMSAVWDAIVELRSGGAP